MTDSRHFYRDLPALDTFSEAVEVKRHVSVPEDWWIVIADVIGSTQAIQDGDYKKVNTVGAACIAAVVNVDRSIDIPFAFGGDGATFAVPDNFMPHIISVLRGAQKLSRVNFGLDLRVGMVKVGELTRQDFWVDVAKIRLSSYMTQAAFSGRGWHEAERRVKTPHATGVLIVREDGGPAEANFEGFECRWKSVPNFNGHKLSLLVTAMSHNPSVNLETYQAVSKKIHAIYGDVANYHPLRPKRLRMAFSPWLLSHEWRVRTSELSWGKRIGYFINLLFLNLAGLYLFIRNIDTKAVKWTHYRRDMVDNTDFRKFDGVLRMVIDGSDAQTVELEEYLESQHKAGLLIYGMYKSPEALVTCLVQSYNGKHMHFVDGSDGGYALAARGLKQQLKALRTKNIIADAAIFPSASL